MTTYRIDATFTEPCLGTSPSNPTVYSDFIVAKALTDATKTQKLDADEQKALKDEIQLKTEEELGLLPAEDPDSLTKGTTVFRRDPETGGLILMDYMARGFVKEAAAAMSGIWGIDSKLSRWVFIGKFIDGEFKSDRRILLFRDGKLITQPDSLFQRPLRAETMRGPRVTLACSEQVDAGATFSFHITVLPLAETANALGKGKGGITQALLTEWVTTFGQLQGIGQYRSGSYGRIRSTVTK